MEYTIVSLEYSNKETVDVKLPLYVPIEGIIEALQNLDQILEWQLPRDFILQFRCPGDSSSQPLSKDKSLAEAKCWSGSHIKIIPQNK